MNYTLEGYKLTNRIGSVIAPNWAAKNASIKFLKPNRYPIKAWEREAEQVGTRFNLSEQVSVIRWPQNLKADNAKLSGSGKQVLLVHGWESRATQMYGLVKGLVKQGYTVFAVDMPGHGHSSGDTSNAYLFSQTVRLAQQELGHFYAIIGHSMGAGAAAIAVGKGVTTEKLVLISGPSSIENVLRRFSSFVGLNKKTTNKFIDFIGHYVGVPAAELDATKLLQSSDIPALLIHDEHDIEVPVSESTRLAPVFNQSELFVTQGLGHRKILKSDEVFAKISRFVNEEAR
jgi:pimeloyl-ACP methyl ester carboxylesterase